MQKSKTKIIIFWRQYSEKHRENMKIVKNLQTVGGGGSTFKKKTGESGNPGVGGGVSQILGGGAGYRLPSTLLQRAQMSWKSWNVLEFLEMSWN